MIKDPCFPCKGELLSSFAFIISNWKFFLLLTTLTKIIIWNIFEIVASISKLVKKLVNYYWYFESINSMRKTSIELWKWWKKYKSMFPNMAF
jgi:hypothetical protein